MYNFNTVRGKCDYFDLQQLTKCEYAHWLLRRKLHIFTHVVNNAQIHALK